MTVIDFERSKMDSSITEPDPLSVDRKRKFQGGSLGGKSTKISERSFAQELEEARRGLYELT